MQSPTQPAPVSKATLWTGRIISALPVALLIFSAALKLARPMPVVEGFAHYGYPQDLITPIGILELSCTVMYAIPQTAVLGAILMTAYLGGATATNVRVGDHSFIATVVLGVLVWLGLFLRDARMRELVPLRRLRATPNVVTQ